MPSLVGPALLGDLRILGLKAKEGDVGDLGLSGGAQPTIQILQSFRIVRVWKLRAARAGLLQLSTEPILREQTPS